MNISNAMSRRALAISVMASLAACMAPTEQDSARSEGEAIVNGTPVTLATNTFVRLPASACTGTLLANQWVLTAHHCASHVGDPVFMDSQSSTVARVVPNPDVSFGVDIVLLQLATPMSVLGSTSGFSRGLRATTAPPGTHVRCFGYGLSFNAPGITSQLRLMELGTGGGASNVYVFDPNSLGQSAAPGDAGGACLDDTGAALAVMNTFNQAPSVPGESFAITSDYYASWANLVLAGGCTVNSDCATGICNFSSHACVTSTCQDGRRDNGETGVDCGGSCKACKCPIGTHDCGGTCISNKLVCP